jgi:hypothetical protein
VRVDFPDALHPAEREALRRALDVEAIDDSVTEVILIFRFHAQPAAWSQLSGQQRAAW